MVRGIEANILRNDDGFPMQVNLKKGPQKLTIDYPADQNNFIIKGDEELLPVLNQIYPFTATPKLSIPQPLQTVSVQGGKTVLFDDFETLLKWEQITATVAIDNTIAFNGSQSLKLTSGLGTIPVALRYFSAPLTSKIRFSCIWGVDDFSKLDDIDFLVAFSNGQTIYTPTIQYVAATHLWQYRDLSGAYVTIDGSYLAEQYQALGGPQGAWHKITVEFDYMNSYLSLQTDYRKFNLETTSGQPYKTAAGTVLSAYVQLAADAAAGQIVNAWFDDVLIEAIP